MKNLIDRIAWNKSNNLVPAIVQNSATGEVLMLGHMNPEALQSTLETGRVTFFSRCRQRLWTKGEISGNVLKVSRIRIDCDADTLLISATPAGPVCHRGTPTCFDEKEEPSVFPDLFLTTLEQIIEQRMEDKPEGSYTARLLESGTAGMAQKVGEEGVEVALAAATGNTVALGEETADLLYHLLVLLRSQGLHLHDVVRILYQRHRAPEEW